MQHPPQTRHVCTGGATARCAAVLLTITMISGAALAAAPVPSTLEKDRCLHDVRCREALRQHLGDVEALRDATSLATSQPLPERTLRFRAGPALLGRRAYASMAAGFDLGDLEMSIGFDSALHKQGGPSSLLFAGFTIQGYESSEVHLLHIAFAALPDALSWRTPWLRVRGLLRFVTGAAIEFRSFRADDEERDIPSDLLLLPFVGVGGGAEVCYPFAHLGPVPILSRLEVGLSLLLDARWTELAPGRLPHTTTWMSGGLLLRYAIR